jgi:hypothetical protein
MSETIQKSAGGPFSRFRMKIELWAALLLMGAGFVGGLLAASPPRVEQLPQEPVQQRVEVAPPLTEEQLGDELPDGHPPLPDDPVEQPDQP